MSQDQRSNGRAGQLQPRNPGSAPEFGLLSRTLVHSSVVKQILPARIRRADLNDVVFIGETFVELHLLTETGKLQQEGIKTDFHADIRDAKVFGLQRESNLSGVPSDVSMHGNGYEDVKLRHPADILTLTLDSGHLTFLYARNCNEQGQVDFVMSTRRIDSRGVHPTHLGKGIAVDHRSRAMAVCAYQDTFRIYSLHPMDELHRQMDAGSSLNPIKEENTFEVRGVILHMEFLHPSPGDNDHVILLLFIIDSNQVSRLQIYEWPTSQPLSTAHRNGQRGIGLLPDVSMPLHVIPLVIQSAFLLVTETSTLVLRAADVLSGSTKGHKVPFLSTPTDGHRQALVTAWARPFRHPIYSGNHDDMYLAMENGDIYFLEVDAEERLLVQTATKASTLDCSIGTAFAALDYGLGHHDMLVAGGEMSSGGVYLLEVRPYPVSTATEAKLEESVTNWAPVFDFELVNLPAQGHSIGAAARDRVFACTGRGRHGAITELRYGIQARILNSAEYINGIRRIFLLPDAATKGYFVLSSLADHSQMCFLSPLNTGEWTECGDQMPFVLDEPTLAAGGFCVTENENGESSRLHISNGAWSIQVSPSAISVACLRSDRDLMEDVGMDGDETQFAGRKLQKKCDDGEIILAAAVRQDLVLVAMRQVLAVDLILVSISVRDDSENFMVPTKSSIRLEDDPAFVTLVELRNRNIAVVGTRQATVQLFLCLISAEEPIDLRPLLEVNMVVSSIQTEHDLFVCESAVVIESDTASKLLCGLRNGTVLVFDMKTTQSELQAVHSREIKFGPIPVQLHLDARRKDSAFVLAGPEIYRFDMPQDGFRAAQLVFKDSNEDPIVQAFAQVDNDSDPENIIICATRDTIFYADIGQSERLCGRRLRLYETPRRVMFYRPLNVFLVACTRPTRELPQDGAEEIHYPEEPRHSYCSLRIIDPRTGDSRSDTNLVCSKKKDPIFGVPNEQIYCIAEWNVQFEGKQYRYVVLSTGFINNSPGEHPKGRVVILSLKETEPGRIEVRRNFSPIVCDGPVFSVAQYGDSSLVYCAGKKLIMRTLTRKNPPQDTGLGLEEIADMTLRSPAVHISAPGPFIYLSCAVDSVLVTKFEDGQLIECFSDGIARNGFTHSLIFPDMVLASDKTYGVVGLWRPHERRSLESLTPIFEAELSSSVSRIRIGHCRPPWSTPNSDVPGVISNGNSRSLIAAGVDGSFFQLTILSKESLKLLRYVQELYRMRTSRSVPMRLFLDDDDQLSAQIDPLERHVNGDLLVPVVKLGSSWLRSAVMRCDAVAHGVGVARTRFEDTARELLGKDTEDLYAAVVSYIKELLNDSVL